MTSPHFARKWDGAFPAEQADKWTSEPCWFTGLLVLVVRNKVLVEYLGRHPGLLEGTTCDQSLRRHWLQWHHRGLRCIVFSLGCCGQSKREKSIWVKDCSSYFIPKVTVQRARHGTFSNMVQ